MESGPDRIREKRFHEQLSLCYAALDLQSKVRRAVIDGRELAIAFATLRAIDTA